MCDEECLWHAGLDFAPPTTHHELEVKRYLVVFQSRPEPPYDATIVDVRAGSELEAILEAKNDAPPHHPWRIAHARVWPRGCASVDEAAGWYQIAM